VFRTVLYGLLAVMFGEQAYRHLRSGRVDGFFVATKTFRPAVFWSFVVLQVLLAIANGYFFIERFA
jgi:hypothetical protein